MSPKQAAQAVKTLQEDGKPLAGIILERPDLRPALWVIELPLDEQRQVVETLLSQGVTLYELSKYPALAEAVKDSQDGQRSRFLNWKCA